MIGLFFEDINYGLDGGLYAEMIENRSFEFVEAYGSDKEYKTRFAGDYGWSSYLDTDNSSKLEIASEKPLCENNPHYLVFQSVKSNASFSNKAFDGISMKAFKQYKVSFYARFDSYEGSIIISIIKNNKSMALAMLPISDNQGWNKYEADIYSNEDVYNGDFVITLEQKGKVCFDMISMLPADAVYGIFRKDLVEKLEKIKPGFLRFPGGCVVEGANLSNRYRWKDGLGNLEQRIPNWNRWAVHDNSSAEGEKIRYSYYNQSMGIGFYEFFLLCKYLGAKPLPVMNVGIACQYQSDEKVNIDDTAFEEYIQDTLDLIEFANGDATTTWGKIRIDMGHAGSFGLELVGIGNEQWESEKIDFFERYRRFEKAIHAKYPEIKLIGTAGPDVHSEKYKAAWEFYYKENERNPDFVYAVDEHYYMNPKWFLDNTHFYDSYSRKIKVFAGEYAAHCDNGMNRPELNNWWAALSEAAFMTGFERNADVVEFAAYAPLLARKGYTQWSPDLIWFDGETSYGTPSYYVQLLFSNFKGDYTLQTETEDMVLPYSISFCEKDKTVFIKLVNTMQEAIKVCLEPDFHVLPEAEVIMMQADEKAGNSFKNPNKIVPVKQSIHFKKGMSYELQPSSFHVIKLTRKDY